MTHYLVMDRSDMDKYLTYDERVKLSILNEKMCEGRESDGKQRGLMIQHFINNYPETMEQHQEIPGEVAINAIHKLEQSYWEAKHRAELADKRLIAANKSDTDCWAWTDTDNFLESLSNSSVIKIRADDLRKLLETRTQKSTT